jgi:hypothetical protein
LRHWCALPAKLLFLPRVCLHLIYSFADAIVVGGSCLSGSPLDADTRARTFRTNPHRYDAWRVGAAAVQV